MSLRTVSMNQNWGNIRARFCRFSGAISIGKYAPPRIAPTVQKPIINADKPFFDLINKDASIIKQVTNNENNIISKNNLYTGNPI